MKKEAIEQSISTLKRYLFILFVLGGLNIALRSWAKLSNETGLSVIQGITVIRILALILIWGFTARACGTLSVEIGGKHKGPALTVLLLGLADCFIFPAFGLIGWFYALSLVFKAKRILKKLPQPEPAKLPERE